MVAELKSVPFYKPNVLAMLNTLFPPSIRELPNDRILPKVLHQYRSTFYRYITAVEVNGPGVMRLFEDKLQKDDNRHSWRSTWDNLQHYIELAELMIKQADAVIGPGIELFVGEYTYDSPLAKRERQDPSSHSSISSVRTISDATFSSSFEGPTSRARTPRTPGSSFSSGKVRSHSRSRTNTRSDTSTSFERPSISSYSAKPSQDGRSTSSLSLTPSLPKLDTDSIRSRQRAVSKPVMPFIAQDSPAAQHEAFSSPIILPDPRKVIQEKRRNIEARRPSNSQGEGTPLVEDTSPRHPSTSSDQGKPAIEDSKRLRSVSFYDARMDGPSMPPSLTPGSKKLPSDGGAFLNRPYEEPAHIERSIRKKPSFSRLFLRKNSLPSTAGEEEVYEEPNALGISTTPKPILKTSKSMDPVPRTPNDTSDAPVLRAQRSFGESLRAKFNMKAAEGSSKVSARDPSNDDADSKAKAMKNQESSASIKEPKPPKTPLALTSPHFEEFPKYVPGTVPELWRPILSKQDSFDLKNKGGKYGQGEGTTPVFERPADSLYPELRKQVGIEDEKPKSKARSKFEALMVKRGLRPAENNSTEGEPKEPKKIPMEPLIVTTTEQRLGPILSEFNKGIETGGEYERFIIVAEGSGEEDRPSPSDLGDALPTSPTPGRLRPTKSMGDLKYDWALTTVPKKKPIKVLKKIMKRNVTGTLITTADISSPIPQASPEWEEDLIATISKEHTRQWLMEEARARRQDLLKPQGRPVNKEMPKKRLQQRKSPLPGVALQPKRVRILKEPVVIRAFEEPRATPKPPQLPYRARKDSIFAPREPPPPPPPAAKKSRELDVSKYSKF
jgi:hypothetical protein